MDRLDYPYSRFSGCGFFAFGEFLVLLLTHGDT